VPPLHRVGGGDSADEHEEALELALAMAEADARGQDYEGSLRWLGVAEQLNLTLPATHTALRERCERELRLQRS
jgi:hypothetical protein